MAGGNVESVLCFYFPLTKFVQEEKERKLCGHFFVGDQGHQSGGRSTAQGTRKGEECAGAGGTVAVEALGERWPSAVRVIALVSVRGRGVGTVNRKEGGGVREEEKKGILVYNISTVNK